MIWFGVGENCAGVSDVSSRSSASDSDNLYFVCRMDRWMVGYIDV